MDLRLELVRRIAAGERITDLCQEYGISRKTVWKFQKRYESHGESGLVDQSRAPIVIPHKTPLALEELIVERRQRQPSWGPKKLKAVLERELGTTLPSATTVGAILTRRGLIEPRKRRKRVYHAGRPTRLREAFAPNDLWCIDYKGQFRLGDGTQCYPLTITDQYSRYLLCCEGMAAISDEQAREECFEVFRQYGLPAAIRSDNGVPFASTGLCNLTKLSAMWLRLGIEIEHIEPGKPQENGRHERMHRTLKFATARPARQNLLQQQDRFDEFALEFNEQRPHEALDQRTPAAVYVASTRRCPPRLPALSYPGYDDVLRVNVSGQINLAGYGQIALTRALAGEEVGVREEPNGQWLVSYAGLYLGHVNRDRTITPYSVSPSSEAPTT